MHFDGVCAKIYKPCTFMECTLFAVKNEEVSVAMSNHNEKYEKLASVIEEHRTQKGGLMPVLQEAQAIFGCVPVDVQEIIAEGMGKTLSEVYGVATFYSQFSLEPKGQYVCGVCLGTACYVKGSQKVLDKPGGRASDRRWPHHGGRKVHHPGDPLPWRLRSGPGYDDQRRSVRPSDAGRNSRHPGYL